MNDFLERVAVENSNKCNQLGTEIEDLKRKMADLICNYNIVVGMHNELADRIDRAIEYIENKSLYKEVVDYDYEENPIYVGANDEEAKEDLLNILKDGNNE